MISPSLNWTTLQPKKQKLPGINTFHLPEGTLQVPFQNLLAQSSTIQYDWMVYLTCPSTILHLCRYGSNNTGHGQIISSDSPNLQCLWCQYIFVRTLLSWILLQEMLKVSTHNYLLMCALYSQACSRIFYYHERLSVNLVNTKQ